MPRELAIMDALMPTLFLAFIGAGIATWLVDTCMAYYRIYRWVGYPALFRVAIFFLVFSGMGLVVY